MGAKYTSKSASGYNSTPPSDNGAQTAANLVKWSTHKTKLTDPIKTLAEDINTALVTAMDYSVRQITSSDSTVAGDHMRCVEIAPSVTAAVTVSLGDAATMGSVYRVYIKNSSARNQTLGRATGGDTIDGTAGNVTLPPGGGIIVQTNATPDGYLVVARHGPLVDSDAVAVGSSDGTKKVRLEVDGVTAATTRVLTVPDFDGTIATLAGTEALTNKTINLSSNTLTGTTAQFNTALSDGDFATLAGSEALTNKTLTSPTIQGTVGAGTGLTLPALVLSGNVTSSGNPSLSIGTGALTAGASNLGGVTITGTGVLTVPQTGATQAINVTANTVSNAVIKLDATASNGYGASVDYRSKTSGGVSNSWAVGTGVTGGTNAFEWYDGTATRMSLAIGGGLTVDKTIKTGGYTVGTLPAGTVGMRAYVTDATGPTYNGALTGGGAVTVPVFYNGAAWVSA